MKTGKKIRVPRNFLLRKKWKSILVWEGNGRETGEVTKRTHKHTSADIKETTATSKSKIRVKGMKSNNELPKTWPAPDIIPDSS